MPSSQTWEPVVAFGSPGLLNDAVTFNFGASAFIGTVPSGYTSWWATDPIDWTAFKLAATITPQMPGYIHARVRVGKASATYYIDPKPVLT